jgi:hypothetical protein
MFCRTGAEQSLQYEVVRNSTIVLIGARKSEKTILREVML